MARPPRHRDGDGDSNDGMGVRAKPRPDPLPLRLRSGLRLRSTRKSSASLARLLADCGPTPCRGLLPHSGPSRRREKLSNLTIFDAGFATVNRIIAHIQSILSP